MLTQKDVNQHALVQMWDVCINMTWLCTTVVHETAWISSENLLSYPVCSDVVSRRVWSYIIIISTGLMKR